MVGEREGERGRAPCTRRADTARRDARHDAEFRDAFLLHHTSFGRSDLLLREILAELAAEPAALEQPPGAAPSPLARSRSALSKSSSESNLAHVRHASRVSTSLLSLSALAGSGGARLSALCRQRKSHIVKLLQTWLWDFPTDFSPEMFAELREALSRLPRPEWGEALADPADFAAIDSAIGDLRLSVASAQSRRQAELDRRAELCKQHAAPPPKFIEKFVPPGPTEELLRWSAPEIAQQLTLIQLELFVSISPRELTECRWMKAERKWEEAPVLLNYIAHHNRCELARSRSRSRSRPALTRALAPSRVRRQLVGCAGGRAAAGGAAATAHRAAVHRRGDGVSGAGQL